MSEKDYRAQKDPDLVSVRSVYDDKVVYFMWRQKLEGAAGLPAADIKKNRYVQVTLLHICSLRSSSSKMPARLFSSPDCHVRRADLRVQAFDLLRGDQSA